MTNAISRRDFLKVGGGALLAAGAVSLRMFPADAAGGGCNVLFLMTDQHHYSVLGCAGNPVVQTPNLDRLAAEGARFPQAFIATPFCSPTRASIITGKFPHTHGINKNVDGKEKGADNSWVTTEGMLFDSGYATGHFGKWHLGSLNDVRYYKENGYAGEGYNRFITERFPASQFKEGFSGQAKLWGYPLYMTPACVRAHEEWLKLARRYPQDCSLIGRTPIPRECLHESYFTDKAIEMLRTAAGNRDRRFMITCSYSPPHAFHIICEPYYSMHDRKRIPLPPSFDQCPPAHLKTLAHVQWEQLGEEGVREYLGCYYGQVAFIDWKIGRILQALRELGMEKDTLVIFTSDHGDFQGAHGMVEKGAEAMYDDLTRVPLIMRYPGRIQPGAVVSTQAQCVDLMPTILDYAGMKAPNGIHGRSLRPFIEGASDDGRPVFCERTAFFSFQRMVRTHEWKYVYASRVPVELYDLRNDPYEMRNLAEDPAFRKVRDDLRQQLEQWMAATGDAALERMKDPAR